VINRAGKKGKGCRGEAKEVWGGDEKGDVWVRREKFDKGKDDSTTDGAGEQRKRKSKRRALRGFKEPPETPQSWKVPGKGMSWGRCGKKRNK